MITKKQLKRSVERINKFIDHANNENILNVTVGFFQQVKFLGDNRGKIHADMPRKGRILCFFVPNETEEKVFAFIRLFREIEEIQNLKIKTIEPMDNKFTNERIYTLDGRYIGTNSTTLPKGIYIIGGKILVK